ncbi:MAG: hypothetical protein ACJASL_004003 [Paraglaciecola sp.]|jgi:hypothetical protein
MHNKILKVTGLCCLLLCTSVKAIVTRHDVHPSLYLASVSDFPPLATLYVAGAHGTLIRERWLLTAAHATFCLSTGYPISMVPICMKLKAPIFTLLQAGGKS